jgi:hypothetical protein
VDEPDLDPLTPIQQKALSAMLQEPTLTKAALASGVGLRTIHRWLANDEPFSRAYHQARRETFRQSVGLAQRLAPAALVTLGKIMNDPSAPPGARVAAAMGLLKVSRQSLELDDNADRLEALEDRERDRKEVA